MQSDSSKTPLDPAMTAEALRLFATLCDGELLDSDDRRLNQLLDESAAARRYYLRYIALNTALKTISGSPMGDSAVNAQLAVERLTLEQFANNFGNGHGSAGQSCRPPVPANTKTRLRAAVRWAASLAAAMLVAAAAWWSIQHAGRLENRAATVANEAHPIPTAEDSHGGSLVAEVTYVSNSIVWQNPNGSFILASRIQAGQSLALLRGQIELTYSSGAKCSSRVRQSFWSTRKGANCIGGNWSLGFRKQVMASRLKRLTERWSISALSLAWSSTISECRKLAFSKERLRRRQPASPEFLRTRSS